MRYYLDPFAFEDPQSKREIYRQQRSNGFYSPSPEFHPSPSSMGRGCWDPILMDAMAQRNKHQRRQQQKRDFESWKKSKGDGFEFTVFPPQAVRGRTKSRTKGTNPMKEGRADNRKQCQVPSPLPPAVSEQNKTGGASIEPFYELLFAGCPSNRRQPHPDARCVGSKREQGAAPRTNNKMDDALFQLFFAGVDRQQQQQELRQRGLDKAILQKVLQEQKSATSKSRAQLRKLEEADAVLKKILREQQQQQQQRKQSPVAPGPIRNSVQQQHHRRVKSHEQAIQEKVLKSVFEEPQRTTGERTSEKKNTGERSVTFATSPTSVYQLPQQFHVNETEGSLTFSIDVTGFSMEDLNLQLDPTGNDGSAKLSLTGKRTNALGEVWELSRSKTLNARLLEISAVEATCEDDHILRINVPKKLESTTSQRKIPIRPSTVAKKEQEEKLDDENAKPFTLEHLLQAMTADFAPTTNTETSDRDNESETREESDSEANNEGTISLEDLLQTMADHFAQAYRQGVPVDTDSVPTPPKADETKEEQVGNDNKEVKITTGITEAKDEAQAKKTPTGIAALNSETEANWIRESTASKTAESQKESFSDESLPKAERVTKKEEGNIFAPGTEIVFEPVESTGIDSTTTLPSVVENPDTSTSTSHKRELADEKDSKMNQLKSSNDEFVGETISELAEKLLETPSSLNQAESFDILDSKDKAENQSWEDVGDFQREG